MKLSAISPSPLLERCHFAMNCRKVNKSIEMWKLVASPGLANFCNLKQATFKRYIHLSTTGVTDNFIESLFKKPSFSVII